MPNIVLFPSDPLNERVVDPEFQAEWDRLRWADVTRALIDQDALANSGEVRTRLLPEDGTVLYRGWMLSIEQYAIMDAYLANRGLTLLINTAGYQRSHHIVGWYDTFAAITPRTSWVAPGSNDDTIYTSARMTNAEAFVVKDYVKSRKHEWASAAYAPNLAALPGIVREFERLQGEFLVGNIIIREFVDLDKTQPEYRIWWTNAGLDHLVSIHPDYDATVQDPTVLNPAWIQDVLQPLVAAHGLPFITTDVAIQQDGTPILIEVGDGQVSGIPRDMFDTYHGDDAYADLIKCAFTG